MSRLRRFAAIAAIAGGIVAAVPSIQAATASAAVTSVVTINATSPHYPGLRAKDHGKVDGQAIVIFKAKNSWNTGVVSGKLTTTATNDTATLLAKSFGTTTYRKVATVALTPNSNNIARYAFNVTPSLATRYKVSVSGTDSAVSGVVTVYVTAGVHSAGTRQNCGRTRCTFSYRIFVVLPASALRTEMPRHVYEYLAVGYPTVPKDYTLSSAATESKPTRVNSGEYTRRLTFFIRVRGGRVNWLTTFCTKDTESTDGLGLPGRHGCGAKRLSRSAIYAG